MSENGEKQKWIGMVTEQEESWLKDAWNAATNNDKSLVGKFVEIIQSQKTDKEKIDKIKRFDVRNEFLRKVASTDSEFIAEFERKFGEKNGNVLARTAFGKIWAYKMDYDYDASLLMNYIYCRVYDWLKGENIAKSKKYEYIIKVEDVEYRGDIMDSWSTTVNEFMKCFWVEYLKGKKGRKSWTNFLSNPENYREDETLPNYITGFMEVVYTIGNFMPVPRSPINFNTRRSTFTEDYWDVTLLIIYDYYIRGRVCSSLKLVLGGEEIEKSWLKQFKDWDDFVEQNYMQPFVRRAKKNMKNKKYGKPLELWKDHFKNGGLPQKGIDEKGKEYDQYKEFFENATERILARGELIAEALIKEMANS